MWKELRSCRYILGDQLVKNFRLTDHRQNESYKNAWQTIVNKYYEEKQGD